jgi:hypothetical protein
MKGLPGWVVLAACASCLASPPGAAQPAPGSGRAGDGEGGVQAEAFLAWVEERLPREGRVVVRFHPRLGAGSLITVGLDASTRAWFIAGPNKCLGRTFDGVCYLGTPEEGVSVQPSDWLGSTPLGVGNYLPEAYLYFLLEHPDRIERAWAMPEGGWAVEYRQIGHPESPLDRLELGPGARPVRWVRTYAGGAVEEWDFDYLDDESLPFGVLRTGRSSRGSRAVEWVETGDSARRLFAMSVVEAAMHENAEQASIEMAALRMGYTRGPDGAWVAPERETDTEYGGGWYARWRWPLVGVGVVLLGVGVWEVWRRRRG